MIELLLSLNGWVLSELKGAGGEAHNVCMLNASFGIARNRVLRSNIAGQLTN